MIYLDDILLMKQSRTALQKHTAMVVTLLQGLGFLINFPKSHLETNPGTRVPGLHSRLNQEGAETPQRGIGGDQEQAKSLLKQNMVSARTLARFLGKLTAAILIVYPAPLHYRSLH